MKTIKLVSFVLLLASPALATVVDGTVCRMNRAVDRMIVATDAGPRVWVVVGASVPIRYAGRSYDRSDLRPGDRVHLFAERGAGASLLARNIDITMRTDDQLLDSILRSHRTVVGRFAVREAKTEFFSLRLPGPNSIRVDARSAYGPNGRVWVSSLKPGDLLEIRGSWPSKGLLRASSINVITDREPSFCRTAARRGEYGAESTSREADEEKFLAKGED